MKQAHNAEVNDSDDPTTVNTNVEYETDNAEYEADDTGDTTTVNSNEKKVKDPALKHFREPMCDHDGCDESFKLAGDHMKQAHNEEANDSDGPTSVDTNAEYEADATEYEAEDAENKADDTGDPTTVNSNEKKVKDP